MEVDDVIFVANNDVIGEKNVNIDDTIDGDLSILSVFAIVNINNIIDTNRCNIIFILFLRLSYTSLINSTLSQVLLEIEIQYLHVRSKIFMHMNDDDDVLSSLSRIDRVRVN